MKDFNENEIGKLLRLKRYEQPPQGYFEEFLHEFHRRQRAELLRQPVWREWLQKVQDGMLELNLPALTSSRAVMAAVVVCAALLSINVYRDTEPVTNVAVAPVKRAVPVASPTQQAAVAVASNDEASWSLSSPVAVRAMDASALRSAREHIQTHRLAAPPRYVLDSTPVSYEPASFRF